MKIPTTIKSVMDIDYRGLDKVENMLEELIKQFPHIRPKLIGRIARRMLPELQNRMGNQKVAGWQGIFAGSGGGWAAIRPHSDRYQETKSGNRYAVKYVTNAIEVGHDARPPSGTAKRYRPAGNEWYVRGKYYYRDIRDDLLSEIVESEAKTIMEEYATKVEQDA